jgi:CheY-like chemotaxis protein
VNDQKSFDTASVAPFHVATLERDEATICALDRALRVTYVNPAWCAFSRENGGTWGEGRWATGVAILDSVPTPLRSFYTRLFERAQTSATPVEHSYECSSTSTYRRSRMRVFRCARGALVVVHSLSHQVPHHWVMSPATERLYRNENGFVVQCGHCRRVRRPGTEARRWDWVPDYLAEAGANVSHGLCPLCAEYHYPPRDYDAAATSCSTPPGTASILVSVGEAQVRSLIGRLLRHAGHDVTEARDTEDALLVLERDPFDVVLLDGSEPGMAKDAAAIRRLRPSARIVDIGVTPGTAAASRIQMPFTPRSLLEGVRRALEQLA